jgi:hypothetical protein
MLHLVFERANHKIMEPKPLGIAISRKHQSLKFFYLSLVNILFIGLFFTLAFNVNAATYECTTVGALGLVDGIATKNNNFFEGGSVGGSRLESSFSINSKTGVVEGNAPFWLEEKNRYKITVLDPGSRTHNFKMIAVRKLYGDRNDVTYLEIICPWCADLDNKGKKKYQPQSFIAYNGGGILTGVCRLVG